MTERKPQRGVALVMACLLVTLVTAYGSAMMVQSLTEQQAAQRFLRLSAAFQAAEAGLDRAITEFKVNSNWAGTSYTSTLKGGYDVTVTNLSPTLRQAVVTGHYPSNTTTAYGYQSRKVEGTVSVQEALFNYAVFAATTIDMDSNARTDSYSSAAGSYGGSNIKTNGDVGSNATAATTVNVDSNGYLGGDAVVGPGGNTSTAIVIDRNATLTGSKQTLVNTKDLTPKTYPGSSTTNTLTQATTLGANTYTYQYVDLPSNTTVDITGNVTLYVEEYFHLSSNAKFITSSSCSTCTMTIYVKGVSGSSSYAIDLDSNSQLYAGSKPTQLTIYVTGDGTTAKGVQIDSNNGLYAAIHAPLSAIDIDSNNNVYGAIIGKSIQLDSGAKIHYDEDLASSGGNAGQVQLLSWREL